MNTAFIKNSALIFLIIATLLHSPAAPAAQNDNLTLASPDRSIQLTISLSGSITYSVSYKGTILIKPSKISMIINGNKVLGENSKVLKSYTKFIDETTRPPVKQKSDLVRDLCNMLIIDFDKNYSLIFRAYNDGIAYRFKTHINDTITVTKENIEFNLADDHNIYFPEEDSFFSHQERIYKYLRISQVPSSRFSSIPALIDCGKIKIGITEADLFDYPGFYLTHTDSNSLKLNAVFPGYPLEVEQTNDRDVKVIRHADYIARTIGARDFPWRVLIITENDEDLIASQMIYRLASPSKINNASWIKPGKVAWDWWNALNIYGVDFQSGVNTETYKYYIDFASEHGIEYVILDEGWYKAGNLLDVNPEINLSEITDYGKQKNVGIILWVIWKTLDDQWNDAFNMFDSLKIKGIKVDFMQRDDQWMVNFYERVSKETSKRELLVDFHGAYKPTGLLRTYPNVISSEGVMGNEWNKWSENITPEHTVTIPFIRMLAGPMDFTPGGMLNATKEDFKIVFNRPMTQGTRCHQLAMYVVYESPLQMLCDNPSNYLKEGECLDFLSSVPTVWDTTIVLDAKVSDYVLIARRNGNEWFIGAMTDLAPRNLTLNCSFLKDGDYNIEFYRDGVNAVRYAGDYKKVKSEISASDKLKLHLAPGGGWAARIYPK
ncbi:MAG TPA: glycoside hydrolase family 97 protein [Ignavibacteriaceae bacterium]|nr:glycoside hydrolase family 97 protein [Ignavibacteriaceae bacterium]